MQSESALWDYPSKMKRDWDERAKKNAFHYIASNRADWDVSSFFESGRQSVREEILTDMKNICGPLDPKQMSVLEIGCGVGRLTRALAEVFGEVHAIDVSGEMIARANTLLADLPNIHLYHGTGADLAAIPRDVRIDFSLSYLVFQHISDPKVINSYVAEVSRRLRPGGLFKLQLQGGTGVHPEEGDTWLGASFTLEEAAVLASKNGFELRYHHGEGTQYFWLWFFKK